MTDTPVWDRIRSICKSNTSAAIALRAACGRTNKTANIHRGGWRHSWLWNAEPASAARPIHKLAGYLLSNAVKEAPWNWFSCSAMYVFGAGSEEESEKLAGISAGS